MATPVQLYYVCDWQLDRLKREIAKLKSFALCQEPMTQEDWTHLESTLYDIQAQDIRTLED